MEHPILAAVGGLRPYIDRASPITRFVVQLIMANKAIAIFSVIALEEIGVPLPLPGDVFIAYTGHLIARHLIGVEAAFLAIVLGSMLGSSILYYVARRYGQPFVHRYGPYMHIRQKRLDMVEEWFHRWGPLVIIVGRHVPGLRMVISVFAGVFGVTYPVFLASVAISSSMWAAIFLALGFRFSRQIGPYLTITPAHLLPSTMFITGTIIYALYLKRQAVRDEARLTALRESRARS
jgi:membrane protein DedA with SNARE-associated domain